MVSIKGKTPPVTSGKKYWESSKIKMKLKTFYHRKRRNFAEGFPDFHDPQLERIFKPLVDSPYKDIKKRKRKDIPFAAKYLTRYRIHILRNVAMWTGEKKFVINDLLKKIIERCKILQLVLDDTEPITTLKITAYITTSILNSMYTGRYRGK